MLVNSCFVLCDRLIFSIEQPWLVHSSQFPQIWFGKILWLFQVVKISQRDDWRSSVSTLEGKLTRGERAHQTTALLFTQNVIELNCAMTSLWGKHIMNRQRQHSSHSSCWAEKLNVFSQIVLCNGFNHRPSSTAELCAFFLYETCGKSLQQHTQSDSLFQNLTSKARPLRKAWQDHLKNKREIYGTVRKKCRTNWTHVYVSERWRQNQECWLKQLHWPLSLNSSSLTLISKGGVTLEEHFFQPLFPGVPGSAS